MGFSIFTILINESESRSVIISTFTRHKFTFLNENASRNIYDQSHNGAFDLLIDCLICFHKLFSRNTLKNKRNTIFSLN